MVLTSRDLSLLEFQNNELVYSSKQIFKWNGYRIIYYSIMPLIFLSALIYFHSFTSYKNWLQPILMTIFLLAPVIIYCYLLMKHLLVFRDQILVLDSEQFIVFQKEIILAQFALKDITLITEYSTNRLPWSRIIIWKLTLMDGRIIKISSVLITKSSFEKNFKIDKFKPSLFPF